MRFFLVSFMLAWPILAGLQSVYDKTTSFEADFKQTYWNKLFNRTDKSEGRLSYQKPGKMRWDYLAPNKKSFILNKNTLWILEPEDKNAYINKCFQSDALTASLVFLGGRGKLSEQFKMVTQKTGELVLTPKVKNPIFEQLVLVVDPKTSRVTQSTLIDADGNKNEFKFENRRYNHKISPKQFEYHGDLTPSPSPPCGEGSE